MLSPSGQPFDADARVSMESSFDQDFSLVRVHADGRAAESAWPVDALAYPVRKEAVFGEGGYQPGTSELLRCIYWT